MSKEILEKVLLRDMEEGINCWWDKLTERYEVDFFPDNIPYGEIVAFVSIDSDNIIVRRPNPTNRIYHITHTFPLADPNSIGNAHAKLKEITDETVIKIKNLYDNQDWWKKKADDE
jgi:hypothetical protein